MRREWIEIILQVQVQVVIMSPSMRREWIEIHQVIQLLCVMDTSPSMRREWIEVMNHKTD